MVAVGHGVPEAQPVDARVGVVVIIIIIIIVIAPHQLHQLVDQRSTNLVVLLVVLQRPAQTRFDHVAQAVEGGHVVDQLN